MAYRKAETMADARKAYYDVLTNQREFISTMDDNERFYLKVNNGIVCTSEYYSPEYKRITSFNDYEYIMEAVDYDGDINGERIQYYYFSEELIERYPGWKIFGGRIRGFINIMCKCFKVSCF